MSEWTLEYEADVPAEEGLREALCTLGNGYFATRGAAPEAHADGVRYPGTYMAGVLNRLGSDVDGRRLEHESMVNAPNWLPLTFRTGDGAWFEPGVFEIIEQRVVLDMRRGVLTRTVKVKDPDGRRTGVTQRRLVSMANPHLAALETTIVPENWSGTLEVRSGLDGTVRNTGVARYHDLASDHLRPHDAHQLGGDVICLEVVTSHSHVHIALAARTRILRGETEIPVERRTVIEPRSVAQNATFDVEAGDPLTIEKVVMLYTSRDAGISEPGIEACRNLAFAPRFDELLAAHVLAWDHLWRRCALQLDDHNGWAKRIVNLHTFHLLQTVSEHTVGLDVGVPARGLHGEAYRGHVLWDELFVFPYLDLRFPELTASLLLYRHRRLPEARRAAAAAGLAGALFPWQSGSDGREESQTLHLNPKSGRWLPDYSYLQRHIDIAIAWNVWHHYQATGDAEFLAFYGAELVLDIARCLCSLTTFNRATARYEIRGVVGPDEFHDAYPDRVDPGLDNNAYTNVMATWVLRRAIEVLHLLPLARREELSDRIGLRREEVEQWDTISRGMYVPFHGDGIISQFEGYEQLEELDWLDLAERYGNIQRLDRILDADGDSCNRYRASKQADVLMLFYLLSPEELREQFERIGYDWDDELISRNVAYYSQRTSHGSTLSRVVHSWALARVDRAASWKYFCRALGLDIDDSQGGTTAEGVHLGALAGTLDLLQRCYTGLEVRGDGLRFAPQLPDELRELTFRIRYRGHWGVEVTVGQEHLRISVPQSQEPPITITCRDEVAEIGPGESHEFALGATGDALEPRER